MNPIEEALLAQAEKEQAAAQEPQLPPMRTFEVTLTEYEESDDSKHYVPKVVTVIAHTNSLDAGGVLSFGEYAVIEANGQKGVVQFTRSGYAPSAWESFREIVLPPSRIVNISAH